MNLVPFRRTGFVLLLAAGVFAGCRGTKPLTSQEPQPRRTVAALGEWLLALPTEGVFLAERETRVRDFRRFVEATGYDAGERWENPVHRQGGKVYTYDQTEDHPVTLVTWLDAQAYCAWLTSLERESGSIGPADLYRLPTDAEWSLAAGLAEPAGTPEELDRIAEGEGHGNFGEMALPVGSHRNQLGFFDLSGNVSEWVLDAYGTTREMRRHGPYDASNYRCLRGGSFFRPTSRLSDRLAAVPDARYLGYGFRIALQRLLRSTN